MTHLIYTLLATLNEMSPYILLGFLIAGVLHAFVRPETMSKHLSGPGMGPVVKAAMLGIPLPLCSCGVLPTAVSLSRGGASRGATTSFLIATPQTGVDSIAATWSLLGLPFAILRPLAALVGSVAGGMAVDRSDRSEQTPIEMHDEDHCTDGCCSSAKSEPKQGFWAKAVEAVRYGMVDMVASVGKWLVIGLVIAALITVFVPDSLFLSLAQYPLLAMLVMVVIAVPMYVCATGSIPIALSLMLKGLTPGVAFVLLMAGPAVNFASAMVLSRTIGRRATLTYLGSVIVTAVGFGMLIDFVLPRAWFIPSGAVQAAHCSGCIDFPPFATICSGILVALLIYALIRNLASRRRKPTIIQDMTREYKIKGMSCAHCQAMAQRTLSALDGAENVEVNLSNGTAVVVGNVAPEAVTAAILSAGFTPDGFKDL